MSLNQLLRWGKPFRVKGQKFQDVFISKFVVADDIRAVRRGKGGEAFDGMDEYFRKYLGFKNFQMTEHQRIKDEYRLRIRHFGLLERIRNRFRRK